MTKTSDGKYFNKLRLVCSNLPLASLGNKSINIASLE
jgi:hypothetical protein